MIDDTYTTLEDELDIANEWIFGFVLGKEPFAIKVKELIGALTLSGSYNVDSSSIEESVESTIENLLFLFKDTLDNGHMSQEDYDKKVAEITSNKNRERLVKDFSTPDDGMLFELGVAGAEILSALFDKPTRSFGFFLARTDEAFQESEGFLFSDKLTMFKIDFLKEINQLEMIDLAIKVVKKINTKKNLKKFGLHGKKEQEEYSACCDELLANLEETKSGLN